MQAAALIYLVGGMSVLCALTYMIVKIGTLMSDCPSGSAGARTAALSVATGFAAIGTGGVLLIGSAMLFFLTMPLAASTIGLGLAALCLGLGFTQAIATLRDVLYPRAVTSTDLAHVPQPLTDETEKALA